LSWSGHKHGASVDLPALKPMEDFVDAGEGVSFDVALQPTLLGKGDHLGQLVAASPGAGGQLRLGRRREEREWDSAPRSYQALWYVTVSE